MVQIQRFHGVLLALRTAVATTIQSYSLTTDQKERNPGGKQWKNGAKIGHLHRLIMFLTIEGDRVFQCDPLRMHPRKKSGLVCQSCLFIFSGQSV